MKINNIVEFLNKANFIFYGLQIDICRNTMILIISLKTRIFKCSVCILTNMEFRNSIKTVGWKLASIGGSISFYGTTIKGGEKVREWRAKQTKSQERRRDERQ